MTAPYRMTSTWCSITQTKLPKFLAYWCQQCYGMFNNVVLAYACLSCCGPHRARFLPSAAVGFAPHPRSAALATTHFQPSTGARFRVAITGGLIFGFHSNMRPAGCSVTLVQAFIKRAFQTCCTVKSVFGSFKSRIPKPLINQSIKKSLVGQMVEYCYRCSISEWCLSYCVWMTSVEGWPAVVEEGWQPLVQHIDYDPT